MAEKAKLNYKAWVARDIAHARIVLKVLEAWDSRFESHCLGLTGHTEQGPIVMLAWRGNLHPDMSIGAAIVGLTMPELHLDDGFLEWLDEMVTSGRVAVSELRGWEWHNSADSK